MAQQIKIPRATTCWSWNKPPRTEATQRSVFFLRKECGIFFHIFWMSSYRKKADHHFKQLVLEEVRRYFISLRRKTNHQNTTQCSNDSLIKALWWFFCIHLFSSFFPVHHLVNSVDAFAQCIRLMHWPCAHVWCTGLVHLLGVFACGFRLIHSADALGQCNCLMHLLEQFVWYIRLMQLARAFGWSIRVYHCANAVGWNIRLVHSAVTLVLYTRPMYLPDAFASCIWLMHSADIFGWCICVLHSTVAFGWCIRPTH